ERHPLGRVPVLEDEHGFVFESAGLCLHLADLHPDAALAPPPGSHDRALVYQWTFFAMTELEPAANEALSDDEGRRQAGQERFAAAADVVEQALDGHEFLVAEKFGVADLL